MSVEPVIVDFVHPMGAKIPASVLLFESKLVGHVAIIGSPPGLNRNYLASISYFIPQLREMFDLDLKKLVVILEFKSKDERQDPVYQKVQFSDELRSRIEGDKIIPYVRLVKPEVLPLDSELLASILTNVNLSKYNGRKVLIQTVKDGDIEGVVDSYDGTSYYLTINSENVEKRTVGVRGIIRKVLDPIIKGK